MCDWKLVREFALAGFGSGFFGGSGEYGREKRDERTYATISARESGEGKCEGESRSHWPFDILAR